MTIFRKKKGSSLITTASANVNVPTLHSTNTRPSKKKGTNKRKGKSKKQRSETKKSKKPKEPKSTKSPKSIQSKTKAPKKNTAKRKKPPKNCNIDFAIDIDLLDAYNDGKCDNVLNIEECKYDGGDCDDFNKEYQNCAVPFPSWVGDHNCDGQMFNTTECGWDGGDCLNIHDYGCDGAANGFCENIFNVEKCKWDGGDCFEFNELYPDCKVPEPTYVGDGVCDHFGPYNSPECQWDGGDCDNYAFDCTTLNCTLQLW